MSFRQDKLLLLLETGTSQQVRRTAAKQLADLAVKTFHSSLPKQDPSEVEVDVKPDLGDNGVVKIDAKFNEDDAWSEALETIGKITPRLKSKSSETRHAAAHALGLLAAALPPYSGHTTDIKDTAEKVNVKEVIRTGQTLLASAGREYIGRGTAADKAKRRKAMMGSLGLGDGLGWGEDVDKVIGDDDEDNDDPSGSLLEKEATPSEPPKDVFEGLSARQVMMLKRKKGNIVEEANKLRKLNEGATSTSVSQSPSAPTTPVLVDAQPLPEENKVVIDPGAKALLSSTRGGAIDPVLDADGNPIIPTPTTTLSLVPGQTPWCTVLLELTPGLRDPIWQIRHGASLGIMEVLRSTGSTFTPIILINIARQLLVLMALDRFGDFLGDTVMAPVRETAAQALGVLLKFLPPQGVKEVHDVLVEMVKQSWAKRYKAAEGKEKWEKFSWEIRHAGLLGLKYEVAVRPDLLVGGVKTEIEREDVKVKSEEKQVNIEEEKMIDNDLKGSTGGFLEDVVDSAILALRDVDDDVRAVAATALLPIADILANKLTQKQLEMLMTTLWDCLNGDGDELGSSTGAVMDLIGSMVTHPPVIELISVSPRELIERTFSYVRHPISSVRLAVAKILHRFTTLPEFDRTEWMYEDYIQMLFGILVLEERADIRQLSSESFQVGLREIAEDSGEHHSMCLLSEWYGLVMTPVGQPLNPNYFHWPEQMVYGGHNVDKAMMEGDLGLISTEDMLERRVTAAKALAFLRQFDIEADGDEDGSDMEMLKRYLQSGSAHQMAFAAIIIQEWASSQSEVYDYSPDSDHSVKSYLSQSLISLLEAGYPSTYSEMITTLQSIHSECTNLLSSFSTQGKLSKEKIPSLPKKIDPSSTSTTSTANTFSLLTAQQVVGPTFDNLVSLLSKHSQKAVLPSLKDRQRRIISSIGYFAVMKERYDTQVFSSISGAIVSLKIMPQKLGPVIKALMDAVRKEESDLHQKRAARSVADFVGYCGSEEFKGKVNPCEKVVKNLFTFLCQDTTVTPVFVLSTEGIMSLKEKEEKKEGKKVKVEEQEETEQERMMRITRRGALEAFRALASKFGEKALDKVPKLWEGMNGALEKYFSSDSAPEAIDQVFSAEGGIQAGQDVLDALTSIRLILPELHSNLHDKVGGLLPSIILALQSSYAVVRLSAAKCLATMCEVMTEKAMKEVVDRVVPLIGDAKRESARRGAVEAVHHIIKQLDIVALPYVLFLIVPILGRMSDPDPPTRLLSTTTFASLVKMVPLEAGLPDPPGFSPELLAKRDEERKFLMQLLDGSKAEGYEIPVKVNAELRGYQKEGVSWLAFLAKYQLHGILCDDMGLGKSIQTICIIASKIHERTVKHSQSHSTDSTPLPSLIVCPPTLTGHWYHEILKFVPTLRPLEYVGTSIQRSSLRSSFQSHDIIIASYEGVRADIADLSKIDWLYCVLDEGHIIKNAKTRLAEAVKKLKAQHRLLLSGTPIQNNVLELWSLFDFLMPGFLGSERVFNDRFSKPILADREGKATPKERELAASALEALHKQVLPFLLRRLKEDVLSDLPPKIIQDYHVELSPIQQALYDEFGRSQAAEEAGEAVQSQSAAPGQGHVFQSLQYLRKLCNHPALVLENEPQKFVELERKLGKLAPMHDISHSPKLEALRQLLLDCGIGLPPSEKISNDIDSHRILIFCQLRPMLDLIANDLFGKLMPSVTYMRLDGTTDPRKRHAIVQTFNADPRIDVLLLTTSVGGLGLNLTGADTVIFVDHDWNPMKDLQAMDRAHRLGQRKVVNVYRLITRGTLEEKIMGLQRFKLNIASSVVTQQNAGLGSMNTGEVLDLFKLSTEEKGGGSKTKISNGPTSMSKVLEG
ncbi:TATA-binding protein-associated factor [Tremella mesenterica]|uniref:TATA-binding protein-associated factor n=1 Tax=Tremella mesenterica TaxID=5217 RepID=A0A4Q1BQW1_TREME|nr:TATA-binding protein-associated factor [Tremella mesenterica]